MERVRGVRVRLIAGADLIGADELAVLVFAVAGAAGVFLGVTWALLLLGGR